MENYGACWENTQTQNNVLGSAQIAFLNCYVIRNSHVVIVLELKKIKVCFLGYLKY